MCLLKCCVRNCSLTTRASAATLGTAVMLVDSFLTAEVVVLSAPSVCCVARVTICWSGARLAITIFIGTYVQVSFAPSWQNCTSKVFSSSFQLSTFPGHFPGYPWNFIRTAAPISDMGSRCSVMLRCLIDRLPVGCRFPLCRSKKHRMQVSSMNHDEFTLLLRLSRMILCLCSSRSCWTGIGSM